MGCGAPQCRHLGIADRGRRLGRRVPDLSLDLFLCLALLAPGEMTTAKGRFVSSHNPLEAGNRRATGRIDDEAVGGAVAFGLPEMVAIVVALSNCARGMVDLICYLQLIGAYAQCTTSRPPRPCAGRSVVTNKDWATCWRPWGTEFRLYLVK